MAMRRSCVVLQRGTLIPQFIIVDTALVKARLKEVSAFAELC